MGFNRKACKELLLSIDTRKTIDELWEAMKRTEGVVDEDYKESAVDKAGKADLRSVLNEPDPATGLPIGVSIVGDDGERRYKSPRLFDVADYRQQRQYHTDRIAHHCRMVRKYEDRGGLEQISFDFSWIDSEAEDAAA